MLLTSVGAKTGKLQDSAHAGRTRRSIRGGGIAGRTPKHPVWYHNISAHPRVELQDGTRTAEYEAREVFGDEKATWWERAVAGVAGLCRLPA